MKSVVTEPLLAGRLLAGCALAALPVAQQAHAQSGEGDNLQITSHVLEPKQIEATDERIAALRVPDGFRVEKFADGLVNPRMIAVADDGTVYVTRRTVGDVVMLKDTNGDGRADQRKTVASRPDMHGIFIDGRRMYLTTVSDVYSTTIRQDGSLGELERLIADLPAGGQHPNRTLAIGPDGLLYISVASTCNACDETTPENATMLRARPDGTERTIFSSGLRNTIGFGWHPDTGQMWGMDHGIDWLGDDEQHEELNRLEPGKKYGWPYIYADGKVNPQDEPPGGITAAQWDRTSERPVLLYTPHSAPMQMAFNTGDQFPADYRGDAFVAMRGSWNRKPPSGYEVVRIDFENGQPRSIEPFVTGFLVDQDNGSYGQLGRLAGAAIAGDGSLLFSDDSGGVIYRVSYDGPGQAQAGRSAPQPAPDQQNAATSGATGPALQGPGASAPDARRIAAATLDSGSRGGIKVASPRIPEGDAIPALFADSGEGISPPLTWSGAPEGTRSYALILEDADARGPTPFVHWLMYNIPPSVTSLREGMPTLPRLTLPDGVLQGQNSRGSTGYYGVNPPPGDRPHTYHFQVFALDRTLELPPGADRGALLDAMRGHVLADGTLTGSFKQPEG